LKVLTMTTYTYQQYIDGAWVAASNGGTWDVLNPANESVIRSVPFGDAQDANAAIEAAHRAFPKWSGLTPYERGAILKKAAEVMRSRFDDLSRTTTMECGKPLVEARAEWVAAADLFEWYAEEGKRAYGRVIPSRHAPKRRMVIKQPLGVVGIITAWNFPAYNPARALAAALGAGCTTVVRAAEFTPLTAMEMVNILVEVGMPAGVVNLINGDPAAMGQAMLDHPYLRKISFTGSTRVGKLLMDGASRTMTRLGLELGGNAPVIIMPDVDLETLVVPAVIAKFRNAGQACVAPQRFIVHSQIAEEFIERSAAVVAALKLGDGLDTQTQIGPMINAKQRERVAAMLHSATQQGAEVIVGGSKPADFDKGYFFQPTLLANMSAAQSVYQEEIFGPVMPVMSFSDPDEALHIANDTPYGLGAYLFTDSLKHAIKFYEGLHFGIVGVNEWYPWTTEAPFIGWKASGLGAESGQEGLADYMETKLVTFGL
jgi:acyl-CoA reductase-like NAD-dependent aldehyde dehydrogenase